MSRRTASNARVGLRHGTEIVAVGHGTPSEVVNNNDFFERCEFDITSDPERLIRETRMQTRQWCAPDENPWTLSRQAVDRILAQHPELRDEIDVVIVSSGTTMPLAHPPEAHRGGMGDIAPLVLRHIERPDGLALDIKACYCSGFIRGLQVMDGLLANPNLRAGLVISAEHGSRFAVAPSNRSTFSFIASDGAGAVVLKRSRWAEGRGLVDHYGHTEADKFDLVGVGDDAASMVMMGSRAAAATGRMLLQCATTLLDRNGLTAADVDWLLPIQTHAGIISGLTESLGWPEERLLWDGDVTGFSGSASIPSALSRQVEAGRVSKGELILSVAVGAGMNCGGALYYI